MQKTVGTVADVIISGAKAYDAMANGTAPQTTQTTQPAQQVPKAATTFMPTTQAVAAGAGSSNVLYAAGAILLAWLIWG